MTTLVVDSKTLKAMPYGGTEVNWTKTRGEIEGKLLELQAKGFLKKKGWYSEGDVEKLYLELEIPVSDTERRIVNLRFEPTLIYVEPVDRYKRRGKPVLNRDVTWRLFWWHFKVKLESILYGLTTFEETFMANIVRYLPDGRGGTREVTFGDALKVLLTEDRLDNVLEDKRDRIVIEAEATA